MVVRGGEGEPSKSSRCFLCSLTGSSSELVRSPRAWTLVFHVKDQKDVSYFASKQAAIRESSPKKRLGLRNLNFLVKTQIHCLYGTFGNASKKCFPSLRTRRDGNKERLFAVYWKWPEKLTCFWLDMNVWLEHQITCPSSDFIKGAPPLPPWFSRDSIISYALLPSAWSCTAELCTGGCSRSQNRAAGDRAECICICAFVYL